MENYRRDSDAFKSADEVEISQTFPYRLLHSGYHSERRQVSRFAWISKVARNTKLERPLSVSLRISLSQTRVCELLPHSFDLGTFLPAGEFRLELTTILNGQRRGIYERESRRRNKVRISALLHCVEKREHRTPGVSYNRKWLEAELGRDGSEVFDVTLPGNRRSRVSLGLSAASLIVKEKIVVVAEPEHLWQQIAVIGAGTAVEDYELRRPFPTVFRPIERGSGASGESFLARRRDWFGHYFINAR
jgi:hypothetical protein